MYKMNWVITIYVALLFFALCPGVLVSLPPKRGKFTVAAVHAFIFAIVWHFTHKFVLLTSMRMSRPEGFQEGAENSTKPNKQKKPKPSTNMIGNTVAKSVGTNDTTK